MGSRGPLGTAEVVQLSRGNPSKRHREEVARPRTARPECPQWLPGPAKTQWRRITRSLASNGLIDESQSAALSLALLHWSVSRKAMLELLDAPSMAVQDDKNDRLAKHPASQIARDHSTMFLAFAKGIGLTNEAQARLMHALVPALPDGDDDENGIFDT